LVRTAPRVRPRRFQPLEHQPPGWCYRQDQHLRLRASCGLRRRLREIAVYTAAAARPVPAWSTG
jgi:hypothetical protein